MRYFVTGTDTGVGKTEVTAALTRELRQLGRTARAIKPIETGWDEATSDAARLADASGTTTATTVWRTYAAPRSPRAAAASAGTVVDAAGLVAWCKDQRGDPLFIEGAGGWMVPITAELRMRDLATAVAGEVIVVARAGLGTINHAILTIEAVEQRRPVCGVVLSRRPDEDLAFARENAEEIAQQTGVRIAVYPDDQAAMVDWFRGGFDDDQPTRRVAR